MEGSWQIIFTVNAKKQVKKLPKKMQETLAFLLLEIENKGPYRKNWPNYSSLKKSRRVPAASYHCHLKKGKPTYVACWQIENKMIKIVEVFYVGTHEKAPY